MNGEIARAFGFGGKIDGGGFAGFGVEAEFVNAFAGIRRCVRADVNGVILGVECEGSKEGEGGQKCFHGVKGLVIGNRKLAIRIGVDENPARVGGGIDGLADGIGINTEFTESTEFTEGQGEAMGVGNSVFGIGLLVG